MKFEVKKSELMFAGIVWLVLTCSFAFNLFGVGLYQGWFDDFQKDSSLIVEKAAVCKDGLSYRGPAIPASSNADYMKLMASNDCTASKYVPYDSQFGLQSRIVSFFAVDKQHLASYFHLVQFVLAALTALILTAVVLRAARLFGRRIAIVTGAFVALSVWIVGYARNLYWVEPLMVAPFAFSFVAYTWFKGGNRLWLFYAIEMLLLFTKLLDGYEHITTISLSIFVPIVFYEVLDKGARIFRLWRQAVVVLAITILAFIGAFTCNVLALTSYYGTPREAIQHIQKRSAARSIAGVGSTKKDVILNFQATEPLMYQTIDQHVVDLEPLRSGDGALIKYITIATINYLLLPAVSLPVQVNGILGVLVQSILVWSIFGYISIRSFKKSSRYKKYYQAFRWSYWVSLAGSLSWLVLMPGHAFPHAHLNAIVFYLPHLIFCYMAIGMFVVDGLQTWRFSRGKRR